MHKNHTILSIAISRQRLAYAVFQNKRLIYYSITSLVRFKTKKDIFRALDSFLDKNIKRFKITKIVIRHLSRSQKQSDLLVQMNNFLKSLIHNKHIKQTSIDSEFINQHFCRENQRPTKKQTVLFLINQYPELKRYVNLKQEWQHRYYDQLFQAIALGLVCLADVDKKEVGK